MLKLSKKEVVLLAHFGGSNRSLHVARSKRNVASSSVAVVTFDYATELLAALHLADSLDFEILIKHFIVLPNPAMRSLGIVVLHPGPYDVVKMIQAEADEMVQGFRGRLPISF